MRRRPARPLDHPDFRRRWFAFAAGELGSAVGYSALPIIAVQVLHAGELRVTLLTAVAGAVSAVAALPLGPWIARRSKVPVMVGADLVRFAAVVSVPVCAFAGVLNYWVLIFVAVVRTAATLAFDAAGAANLRSVVPAGQRGAANRRFETTLWTVNTAGPAAGGALISWLGPTTTMIADAASFLVSAAALRGLRSPSPAPAAPVRGLTTGFRVILGHRGLAVLYLNSIVFGGCILGLVALLPVFVLRDLRLAAWEYGLISGTAAAAGIAGSLLAGPLQRRLGERGLLLFAGTGRNLWLGLIPLAPAGTGGLILVIAAEVLLTLFAGMFSPTFATYRMNAVPEDRMAQVTLAWSITSKTAQPLFIVASGLLATVLGVRMVLGVLAVVLAAGVVLLPWRARPEGLR